MQTIGQLSLNISASIYLIWLAPQILLNFRRKDVQGLSIWMHAVLCIGYLSDLMYGFGRDMQWQYKMVTIAGLISLSIQHYQFFRYGLKEPTQKRIYLALSCICLFSLIYTIAALRFHYHGKTVYDIAGMIAAVSWVIYMLPQILENHTRSSTLGLSLSFVLLGIFLKGCDLVSAFCLGWDYPSKIGPVVSLLGSFILVGQVIYYARKQLRRELSLCGE